MKKSVVILFTGGLRKFHSCGETLPCQRTGHIECYRVAWLFGRDNRCNYVLAGNALAVNFCNYIAFLIPAAVTALLVTELTYMPVGRL